MIKLNEKHHASIVLGFYKALAEKGKQGLDVFVRAAQFYGEERGRRMTLRALRDGHPLDYVSYFAYGEWESTPGFYDVTMTPRPGVVDEQIRRCPWADVFRAADFTACGTAYCREIDRAIVCGFNPALLLETAQTQHDTDRCKFYFRADDITPSLFEEGGKRLEHAQGPVTLPFHYHCGHVRAVFCRVTKDVYGDDALEKRVRAEFAKCWGEQAAAVLDAYRRVDFNRLPQDTEIWKEEKTR